MLALRQVPSEVTDFGRMVADNADWTTAKANGFSSGNQCRQRDGCIDAGIEKCIQVIVGKPLVVPFGDLTLSSVVGAEDQQGRRIDKPAVRAEQCVQASALIAILNQNNVTLL